MTDSTIDNQNDAEGVTDSAGTEATQSPIEIPTGETRAETKSRMTTAGATQTVINIENLTNQVNEANEALMALALEPRETMQEIAARINADPYAPPAHKQRLEAAIAAQTSYETEQRARAQRARQFEENLVLGDEATLLQAYKTDMTPAVNRTMREHGVSKEVAMGIVEKQIDATSADAVLPQFARIEARIRAKWAAK